MVADFVLANNAKIWDDSGDLVFNGIPARRDSDGVLGIYDTVSNNFFTNAGTGTFIAGPELNGIASVSYVAGMYEEIDNNKIPKLTASSIEYTNDSDPAGIVTSVVGNGDKFMVTRKQVTIPVGAPDNSAQTRAQIWIE